MQEEDGENEYDGEHHDDERVTKIKISKQVSMAVTQRGIYTVNTPAARVCGKAIALAPHVHQMKSRKVTRTLSILASRPCTT